MDGDAVLSQHLNIIYYLVRKFNIGQRLPKGIHNRGSLGAGPARPYFVRYSRKPLNSTMPILERNDLSICNLNF